MSHRLLVKLQGYVLENDNELVTFEEAIDNENWRKSMDEEMNAIKNNKTWDLKELPMDNKHIGVK